MSKKQERIDNLCGRRLKLVVRKFERGLSDSEGSELIGIDAELEILMPSVTKKEWDCLKKTEKFLKRTRKSIERIRGRLNE